MSLTADTLAAAITATQQEFNVTTGTGFAAGHVVKVNDEFMLINSVLGTTWITVQRGMYGTTAIAHGILSLAVVGDYADFEPIPPPRMYTYGVSGALTCAPGWHRIMKATAAAMTLRAPTADEEGIRLVISCGTAAAHSVTLDSGTFNNEVLSNKVTLTGAIGDFVELMAMNSAWVILRSKNITVPSSSRSPSASLSPSASTSVSPSASVSPSSSVSPSASTSVSPSASVSPSSSVSPSASRSPSASASAS